MKSLVFLKAFLASSIPYDTFPPADSPSALGILWDGPIFICQGVSHSMRYQVFFFFAPRRVFFFFGEMLKRKYLFTN